ncbi:hypothetical protein GCM10009839_10970 [Catenulispora yoronensis]|uniref:DUF6545 domain-containing protein n=1 Tax=Catenulispora yoronensis TaxID=450799 RepID=A0ABP5F758_9ACTN
MAPASDLGAYAGTAALLGFVGYRFGADRRGAPDPFRWLVYAFGLFEAGSLAILAPAGLRLLTGAGVGEATVVGLGDSLRTAAVSSLVGVAYALRPATAGQVGAGSATASRFPGSPGLPESPESPGAPRSPGSPALPAGAWPSGWSRSWLVPALVVQVMMAVLFAVARPQADAGGTLSVDVPGRVALSAHYSLFVGYTLFGLAELAGALLPQARHGGSRPLRLGVRLAVAAIAVGAVWTLWTLDDILSVARSGTQGGSDDSVSNLFGVSCVALLVAGGTVGRWGGALAKPHRWWRAYQRYRTLGPLWSALHHELPHIALDPGDRPRPGAAASIEFLAYRRAIEIHDASLALRQYRQPGFAAWLAAADIDAGRYSAAEIEAAALAVAVENLRRDRRFDGAGGDAGSDAMPDAMPDPASGRASGRSSNTPAETAANPEAGAAGAEASWLVDVAQAFRHSPLVRLALDVS